MRNNILIAFVTIAVFLFHSISAQESQTPENLYKDYDTIRDTISLEEPDQENSSDVKKDSKTFEEAYKEMQEKTNVKGLDPKKQNGERPTSRSGAVLDDENTEAEMMSDDNEEASSGSAKITCHLFVALFSVYLLS